MGAQVYFGERIGGTIRITEQLAELKRMNTAKLRVEGNEES
jgi:hypothetical protein